MLFHCNLHKAFDISKNTLTSKPLSKEGNISIMSD